MLSSLGSAGRELVLGLLQLLYPGTCQLCNESLPPDQQGFCANCRQSLTTDPHVTCPTCAATVGPYTNLEGGCNSCRNSRFQFERVLRLGPYEGLLRQAILRLKHQSGEQLAELLGVLW